MTGNRKDHIWAWKHQEEGNKVWHYTPPPPPSLPPNRRVPCRITSNGEGRWALWRPKEAWRQYRWPPGRCPFRDQWRIDSSSGHGGSGWGAGTGGRWWGAATGGRWRGAGTGELWWGAATRGRWRGSGLWRALSRSRHWRVLSRSRHWRALARRWRSGSAELDGASEDEGELGGTSRDEGELGTGSGVDSVLESAAADGIPAWDRRLSRHRMIASFQSRLPKLGSSIGWWYVIPSRNSERRTSPSRELVRASGTNALAKMSGSGLAWATVMNQMRSSILLWSVILSRSAWGSKGNEETRIVINKQTLL